MLYILERKLGGNMPKLIFVSIILYYLILPFSAFAEQCIKIGEICVENGGVRIIDGVEVSKPCWKYKSQYRCYDPEANYCTTIKNVASCEQISSKCTSFDEHDKKCNNYENIFKCGNLLTKTDDIIDLGNSYTLTSGNSTYNECSDKFKKESCDKISTICVEGAETRVIDGKSIFKECWKYQENYSCKNNVKINNCKNIADNCKLQSSSCLAEINNVCNHRQNTYYCSSKALKNTNNLLCGKDVYCVNGQCDKKEEKGDSGFAKSVAYLSAVNEAVKDKNASGEIKIFTGQGNSCEKDFGGYNNCCKDSGWGQDYANASCSGEETRLIEMQSKKLCHYVGEYCSEKIPLIGKCRKTRKTYCCFNSKISRVIIEQGRAQLGLGWGSAESPDCRGLTPEELQKLKFNEMDLGEISQDIINNTTLPNQTYIQDKVKKSMEKYDPNNN